MKAKQPIFTNGVIGNEIIGDPPSDTRGSPQTKSFGYQVLGFGSGGADPAYITATGGTITTVCTNYKVHTFTGDGTFCVSCAGNPAGSDSADYLVVAGGGGGGSCYAGGGGAGGYRESVPSCTAWTGSPIANPGNARPVTATPYSIVVGGAGTAGSGPLSVGGDGGVSTFSDITSAGGGGGAIEAPAPLAPKRIGRDGGSGGGAGYGPGNAGGSGNTPPVSPAQGFDGGASTLGGPQYAGGGGGGAGAIGVTGTTPPGVAGAGGAGVTSCISATPTARGGGGGGSGGFAPGQCFAFGAGGAGGGGRGAKESGPTPCRTGEAGDDNTGGGGGGGMNQIQVGGAGGSGLVIIRYKFQ